MKPELILQADVLDILFEGRNKEYGAYELRRHYNNCLLKSLAVIFFILFSAISFSIIKNYFFPHTSNPLSRIIEVPVIELANVDRVKPQIIPLEKSRPQRIIAQQTFTKPLITILQVINPPPTQDELSDKIISNKTVQGDNLKPNEAISVNTDPKGNGKEVQKTEADGNTVMYKAEFMPEFPGGMAALQRFLSRNLKTPKDDMEPGSKIKVLVKFVVDKDGSITGIEFEQSGGSDFDNEVMRVMKKMPSWKPGMQNGRNVAVYFKIPVIFQSADDN